MRTFVRQLGTASAMLAVMLTPAAMARNVAAPFGECRAGVWSSTRNLDDSTGIAKATCFVNWKQSLNDQVRVNASGRVGMRDVRDGHGSKGRLREAFLETEAGPLRLRLGRQIIAWGRADRINPTDNLSPRDYTALVPEDEEQRIGIDALAANYQVSEQLGILAVAVPRFEPHRMPTGSLPRNLQPAVAPEKREWALKLEKAGGSWDGSLSFYEGFDRLARYSAAFPAPAAVLFKGEFERMQTLGADFATAAGAWSVRAEFSASRMSPGCAGCSNDARQVKRLVVGVDRDVGESANINLQLFSIRRSDYSGGLPGQPGALARALNRLNSEFGAHEYGASVRLYDRFWNDRLKAEVGAIIDISGESALVRPRVTYSISDAVKATAGIDYFRGDAQSFFGVRSRNRLAFLELAYVF